MDQQQKRLKLFINKTVLCRTQNKSTENVKYNVFILTFALLTILKSIFTKSGHAFVIIGSKHFVLSLHIYIYIYIYFLERINHLDSELQYSK